MTQRGARGSEQVRQGRNAGGAGKANAGRGGVRGAEREGDAGAAQGIAGGAVGGTAATVVGEGALTRVRRGDGRVTPALRKARRDGWTMKRRARFLEVLRESCNVREAVRAAGMSDVSVYGLRKRDPAFAAEWAEALEQGYAELEMALLRQAIHGSETTETVDDGGKTGARRTKTVHSYPHAMALRLLLAHRAQVSAYRDAQGIAREGGEAVRDEIQRRIAETRERMRGGAADGGDVGEVPGGLPGGGIETGETDSTGTAAGVSGACGSGSGCGAGEGVDCRMHDAHVGSGPGVRADIAPRDGAGPGGTEQATDGAAGRSGMTADAAPALSGHGTGASCEAGRHMVGLRGGAGGDTDTGAGAGIGADRADDGNAAGNIAGHAVGSDRPR